MPTLCCAHGLIDARSIRSSRQTGVGAGRSLKSGSAPCEQGLALVQASTQFVIGRRRNGHVGSCEHPWHLQNSVWRSMCTSCTKESSTCTLQQHAANVGCRGPSKCDASAQSHLAKPASSKAQFKRMWLRAWNNSNWSLWVGKRLEKNREGVEAQALQSSYRLVCARSAEEPSQGSPMEIGEYQSLVGGDSSSTRLYLEAVGTQTSWRDTPVCANACRVLRCRWHQLPRVKA
jgi:hypothetical protein